jgi:hypothetical protein
MRRYSVIPVLQESLFINVLNHTSDDIVLDEFEALLSLTLVRLPVS